MKLNKLSNQDAVEWLKSLGDDSVDLLITDPPYESLEKHRKIGTTTRLKHSKSSSNDWFEIFENNRFEELFTQIYRVLKTTVTFTYFVIRKRCLWPNPLLKRWDSASGSP